MSRLRLYNSWRGTWSCPKGCRGWGTHQGFIPAPSNLWSNPGWIILLYSSSFLELLLFFPHHLLLLVVIYQYWLVPSPSCRWDLVKPWSFYTLCCSTRGWKRINNHQGKILGTGLNSPKLWSELENKIKHWKTKQDNLLPMPVTIKGFHNGVLTARGAEVPICWLCSSEGWDVKCQNDIKNVYLLSTSHRPQRYSLSLSWKDHQSQLNHWGNWGRDECKLSSGCFSMPGGIAMKILMSIFGCVLK